MNESTTNAALAASYKVPVGLIMVIPAFANSL